MRVARDERSENAQEIPLLQRIVWSQMLTAVRLRNPALMKAPTKYPWRGNTIHIH